MGAVLGAVGCGAGLGAVLLALMMACERPGKPAAAAEAGDAGGDPTTYVCRCARRPVLVMPLGARSVSDLAASIST